MKPSLIDLTSIFLCAILLLCGLVDIPCTVSFGKVSLLAVLTLVYALVPLLLWLERPTLYRASLAYLPTLGGFIAYAAISMLWNNFSIPGVQNLLVFVAFFNLILLSFNAAHTDAKQPWRVLRTLAFSAAMATGLYGIGLCKDGLESSSILGSRSYALFALIGIACFLALGRYGKRAGTWWALAAAFAVGASLSRLALGIAFLLFPLSQLSERWRGNLVRMGCWLLLLCGLSSLAFQQAGPLRTRFLEGDTSLRIGSVAINSSGRTEMWEGVINSFWESPWFGKGAGSSSELVNALVKDSTMGHPHSDYLRILHDYGVMGFALWIVGYFQLLRATWRAWRLADKGNLWVARLHLAAWLSLIALGLGMSTDNPVSYAFIMAPTGILVGTSLGSEIRQNRPFPWV